MRRHLHTILAILVVLGGLWWATSGRSVSGEDPQAVVWRMIDESKAGSSSGYLGCFIGELQEQLESAVQQMGDDRFSAHLQQRVEELKGVAIYDVDQHAARRASLVVEYVYQDESEKQLVHLELVRGRWRIAGVESSRRKKSLIPYGLPIEMLQ